MFRITDLTGKDTNPYEIAYALIRVFLGVALFIRGALFMTDQSAIIEVVEQQGMDWLFPIMGIHYITLAHLCGGFMLAIGIFARVAAIIQIPILIGAVFFFHLGEGLFSQSQSLELSVLVLFLLILFALFGAGTYSVDETVLSKEGEQESMRLQRIQNSLRVGRERVMREIQIKKDRAGSGMQPNLSSKSGEKQAISGDPETGRSALNVFYMISAYGIVLVLIASLFLLDMIHVPQGLSSAIFGGAVVLLLLLSMFYMIYRSAFVKEH